MSGDSRVKNLTLLWRTDLPIVVSWVSPLSFLGESGVFFNFYPPFSMNFLLRAIEMMLGL